ncbi:ABC exporter membrane fusion protein [Kamptonema cortianum]|uniref:ABC exporter membrane fusion protein n=1 Tax=Geitlerinema calcuttense NRMC-F 0142 TaxID=2922238 RepID=A0ABT7M042_9CYAN|nr:ABC exporter membrane fusion protein [Geitlerinema calcuttense]MDK3155180.1 ABC exporter membrane fusion protein [Kamptonema cortianum]MDL5057197.1 ABC exporter membrane fusion protein [Geitlerinema calcuttense NRMC-F 0142]
MVQHPAARIASTPTLARQAFLLVATASVIAGGATLYWVKSPFSPRAREPIAQAQPVELKTITALGRLEPQGQTLQLSAPSSAEGNRIAELLVQEGDRIQAGEPIAILDNRDRASAALQKAQEQVSLAQANRDRVKAGAKTGELNAQQATIARLEAERNNAQVEAQRYEKLYRDGAISAENWDNKRLALNTAQQHLQEAQVTLTRLRSSREQQIQEAQANLNRTTDAKLEQINEAKATLEKIAEIRPVDVQAAEAELRSAQAALKQAEADLELTAIRAPRDGQILKINTYPGERVSSEGVVLLGQTQNMVAVAEVYESDITQVRIGQKARISSDAFPDELSGTVQHIGLQVLRQNVVNTDPSANIDARVVEVKVLLDPASSQKVAGLTNLQVKVAIEQ